MYLKQIKTFCTIVEEGSFRKASDLLGISPPSVSQQIAALEKHYNVKLFMRSGRGVRLTQEGSALYTLGCELLKYSNSIAATFADMQALKLGSLSIGASSHIAEIILPAVLSSYQASFPDIKLSVRTGNPATLLSFIKDGSIEIAIIGKILGIGNDSSLTVRHLGREPLVLAVPKEHPWEDRLIQASDLTKAPLLRYTSEHSLASILEDYLLRHHITSSFGLEIDSVQMALRMVAFGEYIAIVGESALTYGNYHEKIGVASLEGLHEVKWEIQLIYQKASGLSFAGWEMARRLEKAAEVTLRR